MNGALFLQECGDRSAGDVSPRKCHWEIQYEAAFIFINTEKGFETGQVEYAEVGQLSDERWENTFYSELTFEEKIEQSTFNVKVWDFRKIHYLASQKVVKVFQKCRFTSNNIFCVI